MNNNKQYLEKYMGLIKNLLSALIKFVKQCCAITDILKNIYPYRAEHLNQTEKMQTMYDCACSWEIFLKCNISHDPLKRLILVTAVWYCIMMSIRKAYNGDNLQYKCLESL